MQCGTKEKPVDPSFLSVKRQKKKKNRQSNQMPVHILKCAIGEYAGDKEDLYEEILEYACRIIVADMHIIHDGRISVDCS